MRFYSNWIGVLKFKTHKEVIEAIGVMEPWFDKDYLQRAIGRKCLVFPDMFQSGDVGRNIHRGLNNLFEALSPEGMLVGTSTDGCVEGYIMSSVVDDSFDLKEWAKESDPKLYDKYIKAGSDLGDDNDDSFQEYSDILAELEESFTAAVSGGLLTEPPRPDIRTSEELFGSILKPGDEVVIRNVYSNTEARSKVKRFNGCEYEMEGMGNIGHSGFMYDESNPDELVICINCKPLLVITRES